MRAGSVVSIRVNPRDSMAVVDLMKQSDLVMEGMSFSSMVSLVLSGCLEEMRKKGVVPDRKGFEYAEVCGPYVRGPRTGRKLAITDQLHKIGSEFKVQLNTTPQPSQQPAIDEAELDRLWQRAGELQNMEQRTSEEEAELQHLIRTL